MLQLQQNYRKTDDNFYRRVKEKDVINPKWIPGAIVQLLNPLHTYSHTND